MAVNKDDIGGNRSGILDYENFTVTKVDKNGGETPYDLKSFFQRFNGVDISITVSATKEAPSLEEE